MMNKECNHYYEELKHEIKRVDPSSYDNRPRPKYFTGYVILYCRKCTDIQKVVL